MEEGEEGEWQSQTDSSEGAAGCLGLLRVDQGPPFPQAQARAEAGSRIPSDH